jgi:hypothetical protein
VTAFGFLRSQGCFLGFYLWGCFWHFVSRGGVWYFHTRGFFWFSQISRLLFRFLSLRLLLTFRFSRLLLTFPKFNFFSLKKMWLLLASRGCFWCFLTDSRGCFWCFSGFFCPTTPHQISQKSISTFWISRLLLTSRGFFCDFSWFYMLAASFEFCVRRLLLLTFFWLLLLFFAPK